MPGISVVIPLYNKEKYIKDTIQSVLNQDFKDFEIIIVNDGSTDHSLEIVKQFKQPEIRIINQKNQGVAVARNNGVQHAAGEIIAFLDADDKWLTNHLSEIYALYQKFPEAGFFATAYLLKIRNYLYPVIPGFKKTHLLLKPYYRFDKGRSLFYTSNFAVKKSVFIKEGGFTPGIHAEDTRFFIKLGQKYPLAYSKNITMIHLSEAENSLFNQSKLRKKIELLDFFKNDEVYDNDLKAYLDVHRFAWIMEAKLKGEFDIARRLKQTISYDNLNFKQKLLINLPSFILLQLKAIQRKLQQSGFFYTVFSK